MKLFTLPGRMVSAALERDPAGVEDGGNPMAQAHILPGPLAVLDSPDPFLYQDRRWCANCAGEQTFVPVDRFPHGWRGYCLGCEEVWYVIDTRTCA